MKQLYDYSFVVWPDEQSQRWNRSVFAVFAFLNRRVQMDSFEERAFNDFREELAKAGFTLREIERVPHHEPTSIL